MQRKRPNRPNKFFRNGLVWIIIFLALISIVRMFGGLGSRSGVTELTQTEFISQLEEGKIDSFSIQPKAGAYEISGKYKAKSGDQSSSGSGFSLFDNSQLNNSDNFTAYVLPNDATLSSIYDAASKAGVSMEAKEEDQTNTWISLIFTALPVVMFIGILYMMFSQTQGGGRNNPMSIGKSRVEDRSKSTKVRFTDVAGAEEEKQELVEVVDFLKNPKKYHDIGARIPKGILLEGPPGTGKTLLAKAVAGEASVPFFSMSGSEFVEMFVGVGASRVRDLFETAKKKAPAIIFIDEIDAVGRRRGSGAGGGGGHDEREQTLNQLLVELDGFEDKDNVIVIAATNRSDVLDPALLRPGRFDRQILVGRPDVKGREAILKVHARNKPFASDVDLKMIARQTPGYTGAELENVLNEAALLAARLDKKRIEMVDVDEAQDRVIAGPAKPDRQVSEKERRITAFHEAGHTICGLVLSEARVVRKVTIVPRGKAGGYAIVLPKEDQNMSSKKDLHEQIVGLLGGRASEEVFFNSQMTGPSNDFEQATALARAMITEYGMSAELGTVSYEGNHGMRGTNPYDMKTYSDETAAKIDDVLRKMMDKALQEAKAIIEGNKEKVTLIAEKLLEYETLNENMIKSLYLTGQMPQNEVAEAEKEVTPKTFEQSKAEAQEKMREHQREARQDIKVEELEDSEESEEDSEANKS